MLRRLSLLYGISMVLLGCEAEVKPPLKTESDIIADQAYLNQSRSESMYDLDKKSAIKPDNMNTLSTVNYNNITSTAPLYVQSAFSRKKQLFGLPSPHFTVP